jgi:hypothetical protein
MPTITAAHALKDIIEALCHEIILHPEKKAQLSDQLTVSYIEDLLLHFYEKLI